MNGSLWTTMDFIKTFKTSIISIRFFHPLERLTFREEANIKNIHKNCEVER